MKVKDYKAWFSSPLKLKEIGEKFKKLKLLTEYYYDYENVYEWLEANTLNANIKINISRAHKKGINFESENISLLIMYKKKNRKTLTSIKYLNSFPKNLIYPCILEK